MCGRNKKKPMRVCLKEENTVIGSTGCSYYDDLQETGITYFVGSEYRNNGYAAEAVQAYIDYVFNNYELKKLIETVRAENISSWKVIEKSGFTLTEKRMYQDLNDEKAELHHLYELINE